MRLSIHEKIGLVILCLGAGLALVYGWHLFWFLTDDAFIAFRYISNSVLGHGYVWNAPPFRPVEGYTSFLWVVLLDGVWRVSGIEPPAAANGLALGFSCCTALVCLGMAMNLPWTDRLRSYRLPLAGVALLGLVTNRAFLAWTSSGLETAMFNCWAALWVYCGLFFRSHSRPWAWGLTTAATLLALTRPEGLLFALTTVGILGAYWWRTAPLNRKDLLPALPLLLLPIHLLWRHWQYGVWLPNTFYAKYTGIIRWESGLKYAFSFVVEYTLWAWLALGAAALFVAWKKGQFSVGFFESRWVILAPLGAHFGFYTVFIGGDHFEFRVYSWLIPFLFVSCLWFFNTMDASPKQAFFGLALWVILTWPLPWLHWKECQGLDDWMANRFIKISLADTFTRTLPWVPGPLLGYLRLYDETQAWLIDRAICIRHQEHKLFYLYFSRLYPTREKRPIKEWQGVPVMSTSSVGLLAWVFYDVNIIDTLGLNDYVVARNPRLISRQLMAHERQPPAGYLECFGLGKANTGPPLVETEAARIVQCEDRYWAGK